MPAINKKITQRSSKKFVFDTVLNSLPKSIHDNIVTKVLPEITGYRYQTVRNWRNIESDNSRDMPAIAYLILCKYFDIDPFEGINIDLPKVTFKDLNLELEDDFAKKVGLTHDK